MITSSLSRLAGYFLDGGHPRDPGIAKILGLGGSATNSGIRVNEEKVMALPAIKRAVQIITDKIFGMPWYVFDELEDGREWDKTHRAWKCVTSVANEDCNAATVRQQLTQWAMTWGNGCAYIDRSGGINSPYKLYPLLPDRTRIVRLKGLAQVPIENAGKIYYETRIGNEIKLFERSDVIHIRGLGPNPYWGWDVFDLMKEAFGGAIAKDEFTQRFFGQGAQPAGFIEMPGTISEEDEENYIESMKKAMHGLGNAHKFVLLEENAKFHETSFDPEKSQMLESRQFDVRVLAMIIGIKVHKLVDGANSAFASLEQANHEHKDDDIVPWVNKWRSEYKEKLLTTDERDSMSKSIDIDDEALDWVPFSDRARGSVELYNNGLITKDEGRRKVNFGPSKAKRATQYRIPANIVYEDDQALINTQVTPQQNQGSLGPELEGASQEAMNLQESLLEIKEAFLDRMVVRLNKTANDKAAKGATQFITWLDSLKAESGPASIQADIDSLYQGFSQKMNGCASTATTDQELKELVCTATA